MCNNNYRGHYRSYATPLQNWDLEGQREGEDTWITIYRHRNDNSFSRNQHSASEVTGSASWDLKKHGNKVWFQALRIVNMNNHSQLWSFEAVEFYGKVRNSDCHS